MKLVKSSVARAVGVFAIGAVSILGVASSAQAGTSGAVSATANLSAGVLSITVPTAESFTGTLVGVNQSLVDSAAADSSMSTTDGTGTGAGWDVTAFSAAPLTSGSNTLPANALTINGSGTSVSSTSGPVFACSPGNACTLPTNNVTYPVTVPSNGTGAKIFNAAVGTGLGVENETNVYWWLTVPGNAKAGNYTTTETVAISSGP